MGSGCESIRGRHSGHRRVGGHASGNGYVTGHSCTLSPVRRTFVAFVIACVALLGFNTAAHAQQEVPSDWSLIPSGLGAGDQFRLLFVTSTIRDPTSSAIGDYDTHVQNAAAAGHADIRTYSAQFRVLGSTSSVDARDHTGTTYTASALGVPIYWLGGAKVADNYMDFYDDSWDSHAGVSETGASHGNPTTKIWTGTNSDGTANAQSPLGSSDPGSVRGEVRAGEELNSGTSQKTGSFGFYGLSGVFQVASATAAVPAAPTTLVATAGDTEVALSWDAPDAGADITRHEYRYKTDADYPATWTVIPNSALGGTNQAGFTVTIETNGLEHTFQVRAVNDSGESPPSNENGAIPQPTLTIAEVDSNRFDEAVGSIRLCVVPSASSRQAIDVQVATADGTAMAPGDYGSYSDPRRLQPLQQQACFSVNLVDDADHEGDEVFTVTLSDPVNATIGSPNPASITILANDPEVTIAVASTPITEEAGSAEFTLTRTAPLADALTVNVGVSQTGAFIKTVDSYTPPTTVAFEANQATATLSVELDGDDVDEDDGAVTVTVTASTANDYAVGASAEAAVVVQDNDTRGLVLSETALTVPEGGAAGSYTVKLATQPLATVTVTVGGASGTDLTVSGPPLTFTTSNWGTEQTVAVMAGQDDDGTDDTVTLTHTANGGDYAGVTGDDVTVTVTDDDLPVVSIRADAASVSEADESATFTLTRTMDTATTLTVAVTVSGEGDYLGTPIPVEAVFNVGDGETTLTVPIDDDDLDEANGSVTATLTAAADGAYEIGSESEATVAVTDDDLPFVRLRETPGQLPYAAEGEFIRFRVEREGDTSQALAIGFLIKNSFFVTSGRMHEVTDSYILPGVWAIQAGQSFHDFAFPAYHRQLRFIRELYT